MIRTTLPQPVQRRSSLAPCGKSRFENIRAQGTGLPRFVKENVVSHRVTSLCGYAPNAVVARFAAAALQAGPWEDVSEK